MHVHLRIIMLICNFCTKEVVIQFLEHMVFGVLNKPSQMLERLVRFETSAVNIPLAMVLSKEVEKPPKTVSVVTKKPL